MSETSTVPAPLDDPAYALALDAGHTAAAAGHWLAAATRFGDALRAATPAGVGLPPLAPVDAAVALSNLGQALARAGCWADAAEMLRRSAEARDALVADGLADGAVAARGWSDLAALLAAAGPEDDARAAMTRAHAAAPTIDDPQCWRRSPRRACCSARRWIWRKRSTWRGRRPTRQRPSTSHPSGRSSRRRAASRMPSSSTWR
jgi:tetratricopeptide (TPR) repeat protein